jgi:hypothetical protein
MLRAFEKRRQQYRTAVARKEVPMTSTHLPIADTSAAPAAI